MGIIWVLFTLLALILVPCGDLGAQKVVKVGMLKLVSSAPLFIGMDKGFFEEEGIKCEAVYFNSAQPISTALASKDVDVAATGLTAGLYNLIGSGMDMKIVADKGREKKGFKLTAIMISNKEYEKGTRKLSDLKGKKIGVTQVGSTFHYILGRLLEEEGLSLKDVEVVPMGGLKNIADALSTDGIQGGFVVQPHVSLLEEKGLGKVLLWVSDKMDYQIAAIVYGERMFKERDVGSAFMRAYRKSTDYYYKKGLLAMKESRASEADEVLGIISKYTEVEKGFVAKGLNYNDPEGRLDLKDIQRQLEWLSKEGLLKKRLTPGEVVDESFLNQILKN